jgi:hypothetical protein
MGHVGRRLEKRLTGFNSGTTLPASLLAELAEFGADLFIDTYVSETE